MKQSIQKRWIIPIFLIAAIIWVFWKGLSLPHFTSQSHEIDKPFPAFSLNEVRPPHNALTQDIFKNKVSIVHIWAAWCSVCVQEHQAWNAIAKTWHYPLIGVIYRDNPQLVQNILAKKGDPYTHLLNDDAGTLGIELGLVGTPETFIVDQQGHVQFHHVGAINKADFEKEMLPILQKLEAKKA